MGSCPGQYRRAIARLITATCPRWVSSAGVNPRPWISRAPIAVKNPGETNACEIQGYDLAEL